MEISIEKLTEIINYTVDEAVQATSYHVNEWVDSSYNEKQKDIEELKMDLISKFTNI
jgi:hypothetical protein